MNLAMIGKPECAGQLGDQRFLGAQSVDFLRHQSLPHTHTATISRVLATEHWIDIQTLMEPGSLSVAASMAWPSLSDASWHSPPSVTFTEGQRGEVSAQRSAKTVGGRRCQSSKTKSTLRYLLSIRCDASSTEYSGLPANPHKTA